jgi:hypothetical protein
MMHRTIVVAGTALLFACGSSSSTAPVPLGGDLDTRIVNGVPSTTADDAVVMLTERGQFSCTGTLVAPNLVITARHCVTDMDETSECGTFTTDHSPSSIGVALGVHANQGRAVARGKQLFHENQTSGCSYDIALILLDQDVPGAAIAKVRLTTTSAGEPASTVGYGDNGSGNLTNGRYRKDGIKIDAVGAASYVFKTKRGQTMPVDVKPGELLTGESTCYGDSGGPLFDDKGSIVGVTSRGIDDLCVDRPSVFSDTATHAALLRTAFSAAGHPLPDEATEVDAGAPAPAPTSPTPKGAATSPPTEAPAETTAEASAGCNTAPGRLPPLGTAFAILVAALVARRRARAET